MLLVKGFTLIELMVVLVIVTIILGIAIPNFFGMQKRAQMDSTAQTMAQTLRVIRQSGLTKLQNYKVVFGVPDNRSYQAIGQQWYSDTVQYRLGPAIRFGYTSEVTVPVPEGTALPDDGIDYPDNTLMFYPSGATSSGAVYFTDNTKNFAVATNDIGRVKIYAYGMDNAWH